MKEAFLISKTKEKNLHEKRETQEIEMNHLKE